MTLVEAVNKQSASFVETMDAVALSKPITSHLAECLTYYTKDQMLETAEQAGYSVKKSYTKTRIADDMASQMKETLSVSLKYLTKEEVAVLRELMEHPIEGQAGDLILPFTFSEFMIRRGWVYLFKQDNRYTLLVPEEVTGWVSDLIDEQNIQQERENNQEIFEHLTALTNLYGVFDTKVAWQTWNAHHADSSLTEDQFWDSASRMQKKLNAYEEKDGLYYSPKHLKPNSVEHLYNMGKAQNFYSPTKDDILFFSLNDVDTRNPNYEKMSGYIQQKYPEESETVAYLLHEISMSAVRDDRFQDLIQVLDESMGFTLDSMDDWQTFSELYTNLSGTTRKWKLRGHTPSELLAAEKKTATRTKRNRQPVKKQQPVRVTKIGRNEPCPCGSGKKYKRCHGR